MRLWMVLAGLVGIGCGVAQADPIDDFVLTGNGHTIQFSLPASQAVGNFIRLNSISEQSTATVDGLGGYTLYTTFYFTAYLDHGVSLVFSVNPAVTGVGDMLYGNQTVAYDPLTNATTAVLDFVPGSYSLLTTPNTSPYNPTAYTLTITPEVASPVPEPGGLWLVGMGVLGVGMLTGRRGFSAAG